MPVRLHSAATLPFSSKLSQPQCFAELDFTLWRQIPARIPNRHVPPARRALSRWSRLTNPGAQRPFLLRTTLTGADEPYNRRGDSRHEFTDSSCFAERTTAHNFHLCITFLA